MSPLKYYQEKYLKYKTKKERILKKLQLTSILRLVTFLITSIGTYLFYKNGYNIGVFALIGTSCFFILLFIHQSLKSKKKYFEILEILNQEEIKILSGDYLDRTSGNTFKNPNHFYSLDIDLFGEGSFFQFINRTVTHQGTKKLADILQSNNIDGIDKKQAAIKELAQLADWRQHFSAKAQLMQVETETKIIAKWLLNYTPFLPSYLKWVPLIFSLLSILVVFSATFGILSPSLSLYWLLFGLFFTAVFLKKINKLAADSNKVIDTFKQYTPLLDKIESTEFQATLLKKIAHKIKALNGLKASKIFKKFSKTIDALNNRNNILIALFGNGFFLWDIHQSFKIEEWIVNYKAVVKDWFEVVSLFDAYNSLANFAFNHPEYTYALIENSNTVINAKDLGHPLLDKKQRITSDVTLEQHEFFIVTGANMAGKSTFLRTLSLHIVMANMGLPVCATKSTYSPIKLITSMRTTDSLTENSSYFFSELTRLKFIVNALEKETYFVILDEILKGTNSVDKAIGSSKFVEKLTKLKASGIIATHDLSLCEIEKKIKQVHNYYFDASIVNDELYFDYTLKKGICENMNASFLLKKMEII